jgi:hypothetical protein
LLSPQQQQLEPQGNFGSLIETLIEPSAVMLFLTALFIALYIRFLWKRSRELAAMLSAMLCDAIK